MAVTYGFFNSVNGDRKYNAEQMSEYFRGIVNEGVFQHLDGGLAVTAGTGLAVSVASGRAIIQNRWVQNSDAMTLSISAASETYARKDAVVVRLNYSTRSIEIAVKAGTPAASPVAPSMTRNSTTYEMALAYVNVAANATSVTITDKRSDSTVCGWATVAQATSGEVDAMLNAMKTGFDGVVYPSPAAMVQGEDQKLYNLIGNLFEKYDADLSWITGICVLNSTYIYYRLAYIWHNSGGYDYFFRLEGSNDKSSWTNLGDLKRTSAPSPLPDIEYLSNATMIITVDWRLAPSVCNKENFVIKQENVVNRTCDPEYLGLQFASHDAAVFPYDSRLDFIKGVNVKDNNYTYYRLNTILIRNSGYDYYFRLDGSNDKSSWTTLENLVRQTSPSSYPKYEMASGLKFEVLIDWDSAPDSVSLSNKEIKENTIVSISNAVVDFALGQEDMNGVYAVKDNTSVIISVDPFGNGDFSTITAACASIKDSALNKQYEIAVKPGRYNENNIIVPPYTHIHGLTANTVVITSEGFTGTQPVFDQKDGSSKLSNLHIISHTGYCIHYDGKLNARIIINENLILEKAVEGNIIGGGSFLYGTVYKWLNCTFINGYVPCHTNTTTFSNTHLTFDGCKFIKSSASLGSVGEFGLCVAEFNNCETPNFGRVVSSFYQRYRASTDPSTYLAKTFEWIVNGHNNKNFVFAVTSYGSGLLYETANANEQIEISGTAVDALFGLVSYRKGNIQFKGKAYGTYRVEDTKVGPSANLDVIQMWKRLGDCSSVAKTLSVKVGEVTQTYLFDQDYTSSKPTEETLLEAVNSAITIAVLKKYTPNCYDSCYSEEKTFFYPTGNGVQEGQYIKANGTICEENCPANEVYGRVLEDGAAGELTQVWIGKSCRLTLGDGRYGIGSDGKLSSSASTKIGEAYAGVFKID